MGAMGRPCLICQPSSRTGENPPYGMIGGTVETSASFEARYAPLSYPTAGGDPRWSSLPRQLTAADGRRYRIYVRLATIRELSNGAAAGVISLASGKPLERGSDRVALFLFL